MKTSRFSNANFSLPFRKIKIRVVLIQGLSVIKVQRYPKSLEWAEALQKGPLSVGCAQTTKCCVGRTLYDQKIQRQLNWVKVFFPFLDFGITLACQKRRFLLGLKRTGLLNISLHWFDRHWDWNGRDFSAIRWVFYCFIIRIWIMGEIVFSVWCYLFNWVM